MKLVGFGCSFTYGSELLDPDLVEGDDGHHYDNIPYREKHCWLGQLAEMLGCSFDNRASPAGSNLFIQEEFGDWFDMHSPDDDDIVCIGWSNHLRTSWWNDEEFRWMHDGFIRSKDEKHFHASFKEWITLSYGRCVQATNHAKLFVNSVCQVNNIKIIQFDALSNVNSPRYSNYHMQGRSMQDALIAEGKMLGKEFLASGGHPNEAGHKHYAKMLHCWAEVKKIL